MSYTQKDYERDIKILEGEPKDGTATHVDDVNEYWILTDAANEPSQAWIKSKGWRVLMSTNGYQFRSLSDIRALTSMYGQLQGDSE